MRVVFGNTVRLRVLLLLAAVVGLGAMEFTREMTLVSLGVATALASLLCLAGLLHLLEAPRIPSAWEGSFPVRGRWESRMFVVGLLLAVAFLVFPRGVERTNELSPPQGFHYQIF